MRRSELRPEENDFVLGVKEGNLVVHCVTQVSVNTPPGYRLGALLIGQHKPQSLQHLRLTMAVVDEALP